MIIIKTHDNDGTEVKCGDPNAEIVDWVGTAHAPSTALHPAAGGTSGGAARTPLPVFVEQATELPNDVHSPSYDMSFRVYRVGIIGSGVVGQYYRVCWSHSVDSSLPSVNSTDAQLAAMGNYTYNATDPDGTITGPHDANVVVTNSPIDVREYRVEVGLFTLRGPNTQELVACTLGLPCQVVITGVDLASTNELALVKGGSDDPLGYQESDCGDFGYADLAQFTGSPTPTLVKQDGNYKTYELGTPLLGVPAGNYKLCFAYEPLKDVYGNAEPHDGNVYSVSYARYLSKFRGKST